ncbi:DUF2897 family protein [Ferrimonas senticii]|uniref:DUF2897 family protein n=1 Tax=Ferrimonas senticii TaxID=394566 RepID=UPI0004270164|nr:DUF2897 family protein [Ferrimonas senticii]
MEPWHGILILILVIAVVVGNLMLIRHLGDIKLPKKMPTEELKETVDKLNQQLDINHRQQPPANGSGKR